MIFVNEYTGTPGILTLSYTGRSGIAVMAVASKGLPTLSSITLLPRIQIPNGGAPSCRVVATCTCTEPTSTLHITVCTA